MYKCAGYFLSCWVERISRVLFIRGDVTFGLLCFAAVFVLVVFVWFRIVSVTPLVVLLSYFIRSGEDERIRLKTHRKLSQIQSSYRGTEMAQRVSHQPALTSAHGAVQMN